MSRTKKKHTNRRRRGSFKAKDRLYLELNRLFARLEQHREQEAA